MYFVLGGDSSSSPCLGEASLFYCGYPLASNIILPEFPHGLHHVLFLRLLFYIVATGPRHLKNEAGDWSEV